MVNNVIIGTANVLGAVDKCTTVERVVLTSSITAVLGTPDERGQEHTFTEEDCTLNLSPEFAYGM